MGIPCTAKFTIVPTMAPLPGWLALDRQGELRALDGLNGALWQYGGNGILLHVNFGAFRHFKGQELIADLCDAAYQTTANDDFIAFVQASDQLLVLLGTLGLGAPQQEVENQHKTDQHDDLRDTTASGRFLGVGW